jgi:hypothetical protein
MLRSTVCSKKFSIKKAFLHNAQEGFFCFM